jgi:SHS2 domain-containing protein
VTVRGHRRAPHSPDVVFEVWAPTRDECFAEAVRAVLDVVDAPVSAAGVREVHVDLRPAAEEDMLVELLEEILDLVGRGRLVPVDVAVSDRADGGLTADLVAVPSADHEPTDDMPQTVSDAGLAFHRESDHWVCRFLVE